MSADQTVPRKTGFQNRASAVLGWIVAWTWTIVAGGGGLGLLLTRPMRLTNGWFALASGVAACPLTALFLRDYMGVTVSGRVRFAAVVVLFIAGKIALTAGI